MFEKGHWLALPSELTQQSTWVFPLPLPLLNCFQKKYKKYVKITTTKTELMPPTFNRGSKNIIRMKKTKNRLKIKGETIERFSCD